MTQTASLFSHVPKSLNQTNQANNSIGLDQFQQQQQQSNQQQAPIKSEFENDFYSLIFNDDQNMNPTDPWNFKS